MILFTNGCSWTRGGGLNFYTEQDRLNLVWPKHLGDLLGADKVINLSRGCSSNQRIVRTTHDWFLNEYKGEEIIAVIQWSDLARYEYYVTDKINDFSNLPHRWSLITPTSTIMPNLDANGNPIKVVEFEDRLATYTDIEGMYRHMTHLGALTNLFSMFNVRYYYWFFHTLLPIGTPSLYVDFVTKNYNFLFKDFVCPWNYDRVSPSDPHPSTKGHKQIAEMIYKAMQ